MVQECNSAVLRLIQQSAKHAEEQERQLWERQMSQIVSRMQELELQNSEMKAAYQQREVGFQEAAGQRGCLKCPFSAISNLNDSRNDDPQTKGLSSILQCRGVEKSMLTDSV